MKKIINKKVLKCFRCDEHIDIPYDYIGNPYTLLEVHYMTQHSIDLKNFDWDEPTDIYGKKVVLKKESGTEKYGDSKGLNAP